MLYKFIFALLFLLYITRADDDATDDNNDLADTDDVLDALTSADAALFSTTNEGSAELTGSGSFDGTDTGSDSMDLTGSGSGSNSGSNSDSDSDDESLSDSDGDDDDSDDDTTNNGSDDSQNDDSTAGDDSEVGSADSNNDSESNDGTTSDASDNVSGNTASDDASSGELDSVEEKCNSLGRDDCNDESAEDGDQLCAYSEGNGCYAIVRRAGTNGYGTFDDGFEKALGAVEDESTQLYTVVGILAGVIGALLIVIAGGFYYLHQKSQKHEALTAVEMVEQTNIMMDGDDYPMTA